MMSTITTKGNDANTQLVDTLEMTSGLDLDSYENADLKGNAVVNAITNGTSLGSSLKLFFYVKTNESDTVSVYGYGDTKASDGFSDALSGLKYNGSNSLTGVYGSSKYNSYKASANEASYINQTANFKSYLIKNANDVVVGIYFDQV